VRNNSVDQAVDYRDGMAKVYHVLFVICFPQLYLAFNWVGVPCGSLCKTLLMHLSTQTESKFIRTSTVVFLQALYGKLFSWIVHRINALLRIDQRRLTSYV